MPDVKTYDPALTQLTVGGAIITGFEPGTFITLARTAESFTTTVGPDGKEMIRTKINDFSALLTFVLRQTADANRIMSDLENRDRLGNDGIVPSQVSDLSSPGTTLVSGKSWVEKPPDINRADSPQGQSWLLRMADVPIVLEGTPSAEALTETLT